MNPNFGSCDFTGGWQDDKTWADLYAADPTGSFAHQPVTNDYLVGYTTTAPEQWQTPSAMSYIGSGFDQSAGFPLSSSLPTNMTGCHFAHDGSEHTEFSDFERSQSSFSEPDFDLLHYQHQCDANAGPQSASLLPEAMMWTVQPESQQTAMQSSPPLRPFDVNALTSHPPNLFQCTSRAPRPPAMDDLAVADPLHPRKQSARFEQDLYTPAWIRGHGNGRSGWCGYCTSWHTLKDSAYWYHMHFAHGVSCATGARLPGPCRFRAIMGAARGVGDWEALCGECGRWVLVVAGEKGKTAWFRHAYKCNLKGMAATLGVARRRSKSVKPRDPTSPKSTRKVAASPSNSMA